MPPKDWKIIGNDDGWILNNNPHPVTPETIRKLMVERYEGSPVGAISWCVGDNSIYEFETEIGQRIGDGYEAFEDERQYWLNRNIHSLIESCGGPLTEITRQFHEAGIDLLPSLRMNSHYDSAYDSPSYGRFRRDHPEWLIGQPHEYIPHPTLEYAISSGVDYKFPGVRAHMSSIVFELIEKFDVDGIELDYFRHPAFFRIEEAYANRYLMTDFIRGVRKRLDEVGAQRDKHLDLLVRVPPTLYDAKRIGLDVETWIRESLVDVVAAGGGFMPFDQPLREFVEAAADTTCLILGSLEALRWAVDEELLYAIAAQHWEIGVDGFYLFNYFNTPNEWKRRVLGNMVDRGKLLGLDKRYELDHSDRFGSKEAHIGAFRYASPWASLPVCMEQTRAGGGSVLNLDIADDIEAARATGTLASITLKLGFDVFCEQDELDVRLNNQPLSWDGRWVSEEGWSYGAFDGDVYHTSQTPRRVDGILIQFDVTDLHLAKGENGLVIRLLRGDGPHRRVILTEVRLEIRYE
ncbi:MAG: hypothetical protein CL484_00425 [Acidobacteria bacterium]|nr:hypothetical protein [Acidobacteriota bacterium]